MRSIRFRYSRQTGHKRHISTNNQQELFFIRAHWVRNAARNVLLFRNSLSQYPYRHNHHAQVFGQDHFSRQTVRPVLEDKDRCNRCNCGERQRTCSCERFDFEGRQNRRPLQISTESHQQRERDILSNQRICKVYTCLNERVPRNSGRRRQKTEALHKARHTNSIEREKSMPRLKTNYATQYPLWVSARSRQRPKMRATNFKTVLKAADSKHKFCCMTERFNIEH